MKLRNKCISLTLAVFLSSILIGCGRKNNGPVQAVEAYIEALSSRDSTLLSNLSCADWEKDAMKEVDSLTAVSSKIEDLACVEAGQEGSDTFVMCTGVLALDYNGEVQQIDLSARTYIARQEGGEWRMCGYR